ncbi:hypothetical protein [Apis mellifera associated microvirus 41]|nr:hypothetical protein [Apis mellifera associated microvirus 41]
MARSSKSKSRSRRVVFTPSVQRYRVSAMPWNAVSVSPSFLASYEDRRLYHPDRSMRPVVSFVKSAARVVARQRPSFRQPSQTKAILAFADPSRVLVCLRRSIRREVLHAKRIAGSGGMRRPRRNALSSISCSR